MQDYDYLFKYILVGDKNSGKTVALKSSLPNCPIGMDFTIRQFEIGTKKVKIHIWDTAGQ